MIVASAGAIGAVAFPTGQPTPPLPVGTTLRYGDRGEAVRALQVAVRLVGCDPVEIDGIWGPHTQSAVDCARAKFGLAATKLADPPLWKKLEEALRPPAPSVPIWRRRYLGAPVWAWALAAAGLVLVGARAGKRGVTKSEASRILRA